MYIGLYLEHFYHILIKTEVLPQTLEESSSTKFHENPPSWSRIVPGGQTVDRNDEANNRFSQFFERAYKSLLCVALEWWRCAKSLIVIISVLW